MKTLVIVFLIISLSLMGCASLKPQPRPWNKEEKKCAGFFILAHLADAYTTERYLDNPNNWEAINPTLDEHPSDGKVAIYFSLTGIGSLVLSHFYPQLRQPFLSGYGAFNTSLALYNTRLD